mmetsp:Transcript_30993/g.78552  ORF Transcript_30993/g.78552 Transcript_30993/m.78552 type:complete len:206 (-) Transcript_30993:686-1303(-)
MAMNCCLAKSLVAFTGPPEVPSDGAALEAGAAAAGVVCAGATVRFATLRSAFAGFCIFLAACWASFHSCKVCASCSLNVTAPQSSSSPMSSNTMPVGILLPVGVGAAPGSERGKWPLLLATVEDSAAETRPATAILSHSRKRRKKSLRSISMATCGLYCIMGDLSAPPKSHKEKPALFKHSASAKANMKPGCKFRNSRSKKRVAT